MEEKRKPTIGITLGDINGIGPQILLKAINNDRIIKICNIVIFGSYSVLNYYKKSIPNFKLHINKLEDTSKPIKGLNIVECSNEKILVDAGNPSKESGELSIKFLDTALQYYKDGYIDALVTAPIDKSVIELKNFKGHTEYIGEALGQKPQMLMTSEYLKVALATTHIAVGDIPKKLSINMILEQIGLFNQTLKKDFGIIKPKIAVLGLNPHSSDNGKFGTEESEIIIPAIEKSFSNGIICQGPFPADGFFAGDKYKYFDGILAMYHDQGLIPFKHIAGEYGVNFTANIDLVRTSPDHGVAKDIVTQHTADHTSMLYAIYNAIDIYKTRIQYKTMTANPLKSYNKKQKERG